MNNQFSVLSLRVATSPDSKSVVLKSLYYRFQTFAEARRASGDGRLLIAFLTWFKTWPD